jgi:DNA (cytosine-5)-methyltransferase 1
MVEGCMKFISLFAGIGGIDLGLERAGMTCVAQVEKDEFCRRVLQKNWPEVPRFEDVRHVGKHNLPYCELLAGGFPCQDLSFAGTGGGINAERSGLWGEFHRLICELRPRFVLVENVTALLNRGMGRVLGDLSSSGYDAQWQVLRASDFGAPHERARLFIIAYTSGIRPGGHEVFRGYSTQSNAEWLTDTFALHFETFRRSYPRVPERLFVDDGIPLESLKAGMRASGNAVVPQVAEFLGRQILLLNQEIENELHRPNSYR